MRVIAHRRVQYVVRCHICEAPRWGVKGPNRLAAVFARSDSRIDGVDPFNGVEDAVDDVKALPKHQNVAALSHAHILSVQPKPSWTVGRLTTRGFVFLPPPLASLWLTKTSADRETPTMAVPATRRRGRYDIPSTSRPSHHEEASRREKELQGETGHHFLMQHVPRCPKAPLHESRHRLKRRPMPTHKPQGWPPGPGHRWSRSPD